MALASPVIELLDSWSKERVIFLLLVQADYSHNYEHHVEELG